MFYLIIAVHLELALMLAHQIVPHLHQLIDHRVNILTAGLGEQADTLDVDVASGALAVCKVLDLFQGKQDANRHDLLKNRAPAPQRSSALVYRCRRISQGLWGGRACLLRGAAPSTGL